MGKLVAEQNQGTQRSTAILVPFKVDLRIQGIPQDAVIEDRKRMSKVQDLVDKLRTEYQAESIVVTWESNDILTSSAKNQNEQL